MPLPLAINPGASPGLSVAIDMPNAVSPQANSPNAQYWNGRKVSNCRLSPFDLLITITFLGLAILTARSFGDYDGTFDSGSADLGTCTLKGSNFSLSNGVIGGVGVLGALGTFIYIKLFSETHMLKKSTEEMRAVSPVIEADTAAIGRLTEGISGEAARFDRDIAADQTLANSNKVETDEELKRLDAISAALVNDAATAKAAGTSVQHFETELAVLSLQVAQANKNEEKTTGELTRLEHDMAGLSKPLEAHEKSEEALIESLKRERELLENAQKQAAIHSQLAQQTIDAQRRLKEACADE